MKILLLILGITFIAYGTGQLFNSTNDETTWTISGSIPVVDPSDIDPSFDAPNVSDNSMVVSKTAFTLSAKMKEGQTGNLKMSHNNFEIELEPKIKELFRTERTGSEITWEALQTSEYKLKIINDNTMELEFEGETQADKSELILVEASIITLGVIVFSVAIIDHKKKKREADV